jgi:hypothetical protein
MRVDPSIKEFASYRVGDRIEMIRPYREMGRVQGFRRQMIVVELDNGKKDIGKHPANIRHSGPPCPECDQPFQLVDDYLCKECRESHA